MKRLIVTLIVLSCLVLVSGGGHVAAGPQEAAAVLSEAASQSSFASFQKASGEDILFQDDFEDGNLNGWKTTTTWLVQKRINNSVLIATGSGQAAWALDGLRWTDYYVRVGIRLESGGVGLAFRVSTEGRYWLYYSEKSLALLKEAPKGNFTLLKQTAAPRLKTGQALAIGGYGGHLQVYLGKALQMDYVDPTPLTHGTIGIGVVDNAAAVVDNVIVTRLPRDLPTPSGSQPLPPTLQPSAHPVGAEGEWEDLGGWMPEEEAAPLIEEEAPSEGEWVIEEEVSEGPVEGIVEEGAWSSEEMGEEEPAGGGEQAAGLPVIDYFYAEPVEGEPGCFYLHWDLHDAESAYLNGQGITAPNSTQVCEPGAYSLHAQNAAGSVEQAVTITAEGQVIEEKPSAWP